jgi:hypothetical protein
MRRSFGFLLGAAAALAIPAAVWAQDDDTAGVHHEHQVTERLNRSQLEYGVTRKHSQRPRWDWDSDYGRWVLRRPGYTNTLYGQGPAPSDNWDERPGEPSRTAHAKTAKRTASASTSQKTSTSATNPAEKTGASATHAASGEKTASDDAKPLTPAEIRAAVPISQLKDAKTILSKAKIKSLWGDVTGRVQNVDTDGAGVRAIEVDVGSAFGEKQHLVKLDAAHLKFIRSRNVVVTSMSKPDVAKLPKVNNS